MTILSVLDQSPIRKDGSPAQAVQETLELAQLCDRLGYHRYWLAEHHSTPSLAGSAPEILIGRVAALTRRIRVGAGGIMLSHYAPLKVAESFRTLETLYPGRIDLGIGRAPGGDAQTAQALAVGPGSLGLEHFPHQIKYLLDFLKNEGDAELQSGSVHAQPLGDCVPELWLLGSSDASAGYAAHFGLPFCFAHFINADGGPRVVDAYRQHYTPSPRYPQPKGSLGIFVICADTHEKAEALAHSRDLFLLKLRTGEPIAIPSPEEASAYPYSEIERQLVQANRAQTVIGTPEQVRERLQAMAAQYDVGEIVVVTITYDFDARKRSYELLAQAFGLTAEA